MASVSSDAPTENEDTKKKTLLEEKSKEELVKIVKKQLILLQKAKGKTDELNQKCAAWEEEKKLFQERQSSSIIELQQQIENLEVRVSDLTEENKKVKEENNSEIQQLEEKLKILESEKTKYISSLNENDERLQCLSMQLNTMKETCVCYQDELSKIQKTKLELDAEIIVLTEARDSTLKSLKSQNLLIDSKIAEFEDLKKKYFICIEENCSLTSAIENLKTDLKNLEVENSNFCTKIENLSSSKETSDGVFPTHTDDLSFLIADNQKLQTELNILKEENNLLKQNKGSFETPTALDKVPDTKELMYIREEYQELQMNFIDAESKNSKLKSALEDLETENKNLTQKLHYLLDEKSKRGLELNSALKENSELKEEIERLSSLGDYKTDYEFALLQGGTTEKIKVADKENKIEKTEKISSELPSEIKKEKEHPYFETGFPEDRGGFEFGLLAGGDITGMSQNEDKGDTQSEKQDIGNNNEKCEKCNETCELLEKLKIENESLSKEIENKEVTCKEYATLIEETVAENESLKTEIAVFKNEKSIEPHMGSVKFQTVNSSTNTLVEMVEKSYHDKKVSEVESEFRIFLSDLENQKKDLTVKLLCLENEKCACINKCTSLVEEMELLKTEIQAGKNELEKKEETCHEYAALVEETLSENESLKLKIESYENEKSMLSNNSAMESDVTDGHTNTANEVDDKSYHMDKITQLEMEFKILLSGLEEKNRILSDQNSCLEKENSESNAKCNSLTEEIEHLKREIQNFKAIIENLELSKENFQQNSDALEKQNYELSEKLESRCKELDDVNFQIELLTIGIKQGVRQKTVNPNKAEKPLTENISMLKTLVDDLVILSNSNAIKSKEVEIDMEDLFVQKQALEDELFQMRELNQFLEDEIKELRSEVEHLKTPQSSVNVYHHVKSAELYSIEEIDEKSIPADVVDGMSSDEAISASQSIDNEKASSKVLSSEETHKTKDHTHSSAVTSEHETIEAIDYQLLVEQLKTENLDLKSTLNDKSKLVDGIHCQMDSLLEKIETANLELKNKTDDLENSQALVSGLREKLHELDHAFIAKQDIVTHIRDVLNELNKEKNSLKLDISSFSEFSLNIISTISNNTAETGNKINKMYENLNSKNEHLEKIISHVNSYMNNFIKNMELWLLTLKESHEAEFESTANKAENIYKYELTYNSLPHTDCNNDCCCLEKDFAHLHVTAQQFSNAINILNHNYGSNSNELSLYKTNIVPNLETNIKSLEKKLDEHLNKKDIDGTPQENIIEKGDKETADADLKSQLADTEVKMNKFKQIALKMKKELVETKKQIHEITNEKEKYALKLTEVQKELEKVSSEQIISVQNYQSLQNEYDKLQDELDLQKEKQKGLEGDFSTTLLELNSYKEKLSDIETQLSRAKTTIETFTIAKQDKYKAFIDLESKLIIIESKNKDNLTKIEELEASIKQKVDNINILSGENNKLKGRLDHVLKEGEKKNLMDLEMADYEKSIQELNNKILKKDEEIEELNEKFKSQVEKNNSLVEEIKYTETIKCTEENRAVCLKEALEKAKSELISAKEKKEDLMQNVSSLQMQLEIITQQEENCKLQLSETSSEVQHLKEMLKTSSENQQRIVRSLESKISSQKQEIAFAHKEVEDIKQEFENYKVRVHSVLKQQKSSTPAVESGEEDFKDKLETVINKLKLQVHDLSEKLKALTMEYEALQDEHDILLKRHSKSIEDREKKDSEWLARLEQINAEKNKLRAAQEEQSSQHMLQNEMLVATYKKQLKIMSDEHKRAVNELQKQLESADMEIARLQRDQQKSQGLPPTPTFQDNPLPFDILSQERQEGEGSESIDDLDTPIRQLSLSTIPTSGFLPFEKLLQSPAESETSTNYIQYQDCEKMLGDLNTANKQIEHLSEVLNDSESTNLRMSEQVRVLKEEIRRLERNQEREKHAENLEYLKNVIIKFSTLGAGSEKAMLIPVLTTMLKLSPEEQQQLKNLAGEIDPNEASGSGWGSYLHRWSGLA
ncbi:hypothetical protein JTE90_011303 [Oedothorax gibbosus]|uniref:GRIP domain-containing protein n=1 Tax=Oedothorax gibbosus TaxID=931172 RepID=A0AAV6VKX8_9ARAC|nr:hypothetical protein JTE90_011303 [Oedothorax gibbosus]